MSRIVVLKVPGDKLANIVPTEKKPKARPKAKRVPKVAKAPKVSKAKERADDDAPSRPVPKASLGAVIASLRALDTSGNQCRKWERKNIKIKSFTGYSLELPSWVGGAESSTVFHDKKDSKEPKEPKSEDIY